MPLPFTFMVLYAMTLRNDNIARRDTPGLEVACSAISESALKCNTIILPLRDGSLGVLCGDDNK